MTFTEQDFNRAEAEIRNQVENMVDAVYIKMFGREEFEKMKMKEERKRTKQMHREMRRCNRKEKWNAKKEQFKVKKGKAVSWVKEHKTSVLCSAITITGIVVGAVITGSGDSE